MKRIVLAVLAFAVIGMTSCKKEESAQPVQSSTVKLSDKKDTTQWD